MWVTKNRKLILLLDPKDKVALGCRKTHNKELHNIYSSLNLTKIIKSRRIVWASIYGRSKMEHKLVQNINIRN
jgi:hypothetical protein